MGGKEIFIRLILVSVVFFCALFYAINKKGFNVSTIYLIRRTDNNLSMGGFNDQVQIAQHDAV